MTLTLAHHPCFGGAKTTHNKNRKPTILKTHQSGFPVLSSLPALKWEKPQNQHDMMCFDHLWRTLCGQLTQQQPHCLKIFLEITQQNHQVCSKVFLQNGKKQLREMSDRLFVFLSATQAFVFQLQICVPR